MLKAIKMTFKSCYNCFHNLGLGALKCPMGSENFTSACLTSEGRIHCKKKVFSWAVNTCKYQCDIVGDVPGDTKFGEDTSLASVSGWFAVRLFAFRGWKCLLKGSQRLKLSPTLKCWLGFECNGGLIISVMTAVSSLLAGGPLSSPGIGVVTTGMVCYLWLLCFRSARLGEGLCTSVCVCVCVCVCVQGRAVIRVGVRKFLLLEVAEPPGFACAGSLFSYPFHFSAVVLCSLGTDFPHSSLYVGWI